MVLVSAKECSMDVYDQGEIKSEKERIRLHVSKQFNVYYTQDKNSLEWENKKQIVKGN